MEWLDQNSSWYEGCDPDVPSHNNALESTNRVVKDESTLRNRLPLGQFLHVVEHDIIVPWSKARDPTKVNNKTWKSVPDFEFLEFSTAYLLK